jgi:hypothetical protein
MWEYLEMRRSKTLIVLSALIVAVPALSANAAAPKQNPIPITLPVKAIGDITFANIEQHIADIPSAAYEAVQKVASANAQPPLKLNLLVGPNTKPSVDDLQGAFKKIARLWSGFRQPLDYSAVIYNFQDKAWALKVDAKIPVVVASGGSNGPASMSRVISNCTLNQCTSGNSGISDAAGHGYGQFQMDPAHIAQDVYFQVGGIFGHEFTHTLQAAQFLGTPNVGKPTTKVQRDHGLDNSPGGLQLAATPCWMIEGQPNFNGTAVEADTFDKYMKWRTGMPKGWSADGFNDFSASSLEKLLLTDNPPNCLPPAPIYQLGYSIGSLVIEALTAIAGPQSDMAVITLMGRGQTYSQAFKNVYGISWTEAAPILARVAAAEYAATP